MVSSRVAALAGIVGPILFLAVLTVAGLRRPGYDPVTMFGSDLAVGEGGWLQTANFIVYGCFVILFAAGLRRAFANAGAPIALLFLSGLGLILAGIFPTDLAGEPSTAHGEMHFVASLLTFGALLAVLVLIVPLFRRDPRWAGYAHFSIVTATVVGTLCLAAAAAAPAATFNGYRDGPLVAWTGLVQRTLFLTAFGWISLVGLRLLQLSSARPRRAARRSSGRERVPTRTAALRGASQSVAMNADGSRSLPLGSA